MAADKLHGDDTPVPVLAPGTGKTKTGRLWTYVRDNRPVGFDRAPAVWFAYSPDRKGEHPQRHLASFSGILQADAYAGFNKLYEDGSIQEAPCMAHIRRKFYDLMEAHRSPIATEAVERIAHLYAIEKEIRGRSPDERREVRNARARPLIESMHNWLKASLAKLLAQVRYGGGDPLCARPLEGAGALSRRRSHRDRQLGRRESAACSGRGPPQLPLRRFRSPEENGPPSSIA